MNKIRLYIEDQEIELQEDVQVSITRQFEELSNPTVICNDYTKTVKIPMTAKNNIIFGNIYKPDMVTAPSPENLLDGGRASGVTVMQSALLLHTNTFQPIHYNHPEIIYPQTSYDPYATVNPSAMTLNSYSVYRGTNSTVREEFITDSTAIGKQSFSFFIRNGLALIPPEDSCLTFKFNTTSTSPYITFIMTNVTAGIYYLTFDVADFTTGSTPSFDIKNVLLTKLDSWVTVQQTPTIDDKIGIYFDPFRKLNFRLEWNSDMLMQGYAKMLSTTKENGKGYYEVTLNGELGKILQEMQKITFDPALSGESDGKYYIDGSQYVNEEMNKELVYSGWTHNQTVADIHDPNLKYYDIINFAPNNAFNEDFDYTSYEYYDYAHNKQMQKTFAETLEGGDFKTTVGIDADTVIGDGLTPRGIGEYRSYFQQPFIYFNKLFQIFKDKSEQLTGYRFNLDSTWFNQNNMLWYRSVVLLNNLANIKHTSYADKYIASSATNFITYYDSSKKYKYNFTGQSGYLTFGGPNEQLPILQSNRNTFTVDGITYFDGTLNFNFKMQVATNLAQAKTIKIRNHFVFLINFYAYDGETETQVGRICVKDSGSSYVPSSDGSYETVFLNTPTYNVPAGANTLVLLDTSVTFQLASIVAKDDMKFYFKLTGYHPESALSGSPFVDTTPSSVELGNITIIYQTSELLLNVMPLVGRSYSKFTLNDLWNNDYKLYDIILNYCKMYRIFVKVDDLNKEIKFIPSHKYFENYEVLDWTDKVCTDKDFVVKPISWDHKYVSFNYKENETALGKRYKEDYGAEWGEKRLTTVYNFNTETKELFSGITPSLMYTPNVLSWTDLYNKKVVYSLPAESYVNMSDEDNKFVDQFGAFYLMRGLYSFDTDSKLNLRSVVISDDTILQEKNNTYYYSQTSNKINVTTYPRLDIIYNAYGNNMCVFGKPMVNYTYSSSVYNNGVDIYNKCWKKYLDERYNRNNKVVTCYIYLTPYDYITFDFNKFVKIENQLYIVNKIYDYDAVTNQKVKVDLITVQDITGYTTR